MTIQEKEKSSRSRALISYVRHGGNDRDSSLSASVDRERLSPILLRWEGRERAHRCERVLQGRQHGRDAATAVNSHIPNSRQPGLIPGKRYMYYHERKKISIVRGIMPAKIWVSADMLGATP